jgi:hypothetical protein
MGCSCSHPLRMQGMDVNGGDSVVTERILYGKLQIVITRTGVDLFQQILGVRYGRTASATGIEDHPTELG